MFFCPVMADFGYRGNSLPISGYYTNYAINFTLWAGGYNAYGDFFPITKVKNSSESAVCWDSIGYAPGPPHRSVGGVQLYHIQSGNPNNTVGYLHGARTKRGTLNGLYGGGTNVLFLDGHVRRIQDPGSGKYLDIAYASNSQLWR
jgi:prepilin-type processing-associated H-X9-DG protein